MLFRVSQKGDSVGYSRFSLTNYADSLVLGEKTDVSSSQVIMTEEIVTVLNPDHSIMSNVISGRVSGFPIDTKFVWADNRISGYSKFPDHPQVPVIEVDTTVSVPYFERMTTLFYYPLLLKRYKKGKSLSYKTFDTMTGKFHDIQMEILGMEEIEVNGAQSTLMKVRLSGGSATQLLYLNTKKRLIEAIRFEGLDWEYDRIE